jgi:hypothetical protein
VRQKLGIVLVLAACAFGSGCAASGHSGATATTVITPNINACSAIDNQVLGRYRKLSAAEQNVAGQDMVDRAKQATDPSIVAEAKQLQKDANANNLTAMDTDLGKLAQICDGLGIGPEQVGSLSG